MKKFKAILVAAMMLVMLAAAGCDSGTDPGQSAVSGGSSSQTVADKKTEPIKPAADEKEKQGKKAEEITVKLYFPDENGEKLVAEMRKIKAKPDKYTAVMNALAEGPKEKGRVAILPKKAKVKGVTVEKETAKVNFSKELTEKFAGGSTGEEMLVGSVADTLTEFPEVKRVQILVNGKSIETISGHMDLSAPVERMGDLLK